MAKGIIWNDSGSIRIVERSASEAARQIMQEVFDESQRQVPKNTGYLASTGWIHFNQKSTSVGYGAEYAGIQHEDLNFRHKPGQKAKYLEDPFNQIARTKSGRIIANAIDRGLGGKQV